jgi:hypothetical protein
MIMRKGLGLRLYSFASDLPEPSAGVTYASQAGQLYKNWKNSLFVWRNFGVQVSTVTGSGGIQVVMAFHITGWQM